MELRITHSIIQLKILLRKLCARPCHYAFCACLIVEHRAITQTIGKTHCQRHRRLTGSGSDGRKHWRNGEALGRRDIWGPLILFTRWHVV